jgi:hypothetical protein
MEEFQYFLKDDVAQSNYENIPLTGCKSAAKTELGSASRKFGFELHLCD